MTSHYVFVKEHDYHKNDQDNDKKCLCCSSQTNRMIALNSCEHTAYIRNNIELKVDFNNTYICVICHNTLKKIELFKKQIEQSISFLTSVNQIQNINTNKLYNLKNTQIQTTDSAESFDGFEVIPIVVEVNNHESDTDENQYELRIKIENESDIESETPLVEIKTKKKRVTLVDKYEGKIGIVTLTMDELMEERERLSKEEKYLKLPYHCEHCITAFDHEITFKTHLEKKHTKVKNSYQCDICKSVLTSKNSYNAHYQRHFKRFECMTCNKRYMTVQAAIQHYNEKHLPSGSSLRKEYHCKLCGYTTTLNRAYRYHIDNHKQKKRCKLCSKPFVNEDSLKMHMYTIHKQSSRVYRCEPCNKTYRARSGLRTHVHAHAHAHAPRTYCAPCRTYYLPAYYSVHLKTHSRHVTDLDKKFICDECGAKFVTKPGLQSHINWQHLNLNVKCDSCSKVYRTASALRRHVDYVHKKRRPPRNKICHFCGQGFFTQNILQSHLRTHTGERPFQCEQCKATFAQSGALYTHIKLKHNAIK